MALRSQKKQKTTFKMSTENEDITNEPYSSLMVSSNDGHVSLNNLEHMSMYEDDEDSDFVNIGYQNWLSVRQEWKKRPVNWTQPKRDKPVDTSKVVSEITSGNFSERVPLSDFIKVIVDMWEMDGYN